MKGVLVVIGVATAAALVLAVGIDPAGARPVLVAQGYTDIQIDGVDLFACADEDAYATAFTARAPGGRPVHGTVCGRPYAPLHVQVQ